MPDTGIIILAAGNSMRMGRPKQLLTYQGRPLVRHAADVALRSICAPVIVVLGAHANLIRPALAGLPVEAVLNKRWEEGMGTSIQAGIDTAQLLGLSGVILALADQPLVTPDILNSLVEAHYSENRPIVAAHYADTVGVPVYFSRDYFPHLMALKPSQGCKSVILAHEYQAFHLACPAAEIDIDTPHDYQYAPAPAPGDHARGLRV